MTSNNRYENGKIYKLVSNNTDKIYIGSTCKERLCQRLAKHKEHYKRWLITDTNFLTSFELFKLGDVEIILLESVNCKTKDELHAKEREYIEKFKDIVVNKIIPNRTQKEYREQNKDKIKEWLEENKDKIRERKKIKILCVCGIECRKDDLSRHEKSKRHISFISLIF